MYISFLQILPEPFYAGVYHQLLGKPDFIQHFQIDTLFLSLEGIDLTDGLSVVDVQDGHTKKVLVEKAKRVICMADHSKFNKSFFYKIAPITDVDLVITDDGLDAATQELFRQNNIPLVLA